MSTTQNLVSLLGVVPTLNWGTNDVSPRLDETSKADSKNSDSPGDSDICIRTPDKTLEKTLDEDSINRLVEEQGTSDGIQRQNCRKSFHRRFFDSVGKGKAGGSSSRDDSLDGLRLVAMLLVTSSGVLKGIDKYANGWLYFSASNFGFMLFIAILGFTQSYTRLQPRKSKETAMNFEALGITLFSRAFRFLLPTLAWSAIQTGACRRLGETTSAQSALSTTLDQPFPRGWCFDREPEIPKYGSAAWQWLTAFINCFTVDTISERLQQQLANLWIVVWLLEASFFVYAVSSLCNMVNNSSRFLLLASMGFFGFTSFSFELPAVFGIIVADLTRSGSLKKLSALWKGIVSVAAIGLIVILLGVHQVRDSISKEFAQVQVLEYPAYPGWNSFQSMVKLSDCLAAGLVILLTQVCPPISAVLSLAPVSFMGRHIANAVTVVHPLVLWYIVPRVYTSTNLGAIWSLSLTFSILIAPLFRILLEVPSLLLGDLAIRLFYGTNPSVHPNLQ